MSGYDYLGSDITSPCRDTQPISDTTPNNQQTVQCPQYIVEEACSLNGIYCGLIFDILKVLKDMVNNGEIELANLAEIINKPLAFENDRYTFTGTETIDDVCSPITRNKNCFNPKLALLLRIDGAFCKSQFINNIRSYRIQLKDFLDSTTVTAFKETVMSQHEIWSTPNNSTDILVAIEVRSFYGEMAISQIDDLKKFIFREYSSMIGLTLIHHSVLTITYSMPVEYFLPVLSTVIAIISAISLHFHYLKVFEAIHVLLLFLLLLLYYCCCYCCHVIVVVVVLEVNSFSETTLKKIMEEVIDLDVLRG